MLASTILFGLIFASKPAQQKVDPAARTQVADLLSRLPLGDYRDELVKAVKEAYSKVVTDGIDTSWELYGNGVDRGLSVKVSYLPDEKSVFSAIFHYPPGNHPDNRVSLDQAKSTSLECAKVFLPHFIHWQVAERTATDRVYQLAVTPMIDEFRTTEDVYVAIDRSSGLPATIGRSGRMKDYMTYPHDHVISSTQAVQAALAAYQRFHPYSRAVVGKPVPYLCSPLYLLKQGDPYELTDVEYERVKNHVAMPLYRVAIADWYNLSAEQIVSVHATDGRALSISVWGGTFGASGRTGGSLPSGEVTLEVEADKSTVKVKPAGDAADSVDKGLPIALLMHSDAILAARIDAKNSLLWIGSEKKWVAYTCSKPDFNRLKNLAQEPGTFGNKGD